MAHAKTNTAEMLFKPAGTERQAVWVLAGYGAWSGTGFATGELGYTSSGARWDVLELVGAHKTSTIPTGQFEENSGSVDDAGTLSVSLPGAPTASSRCFACVGRNTATANEVTIDADWTELDEDDHATPSTMLMSA